MVVCVAYHRSTAYKMTRVGRRLCQVTSVACIFHHVSKLGVQFLGLGYCTEQNMDGIPSFVHCSLQLHKNLGWSVQIFGESGPPNPQWLRPCISLNISMRLNDKLREQSELLPLSVFALSIQCVVASVIVFPPCVVTLPTDISVRQQTCFVVCIVCSRMFITNASVCFSEKTWITFLNY